jgi:hypothetical protein
MPAGLRGSVLVLAVALADGLSLGLLGADTEVDRSMLMSILPLLFGSVLEGSLLASLLSLLVSLLSSPRTTR